LETKSGHAIQIVVLSEADSLALQSTDGKIAFKKPQKISTSKVETSSIQPAGPAREIPLVGKSHLAAVPTDADFTNAAMWKIELPKKIDFNSSPLLRIHYIGDVARLTLNGKLLDDDFYNGRDFEIGLKRYAPDILTGDLRLEVLPLRKDAPIFFEPRYQPDFGTNQTVLKLLSAELVHRDGK
jgi:hypothetical protein